jgi:hypothetical protein
MVVNLWENPKRPLSLKGGIKMGRDELLKQRKKEETLKEISKKYKDSGEKAGYLEYLPQSDL